MTTTEQALAAVTGCQGCIARQRQIELATAYLAGTRTAPPRVDATTAALRAALGWSPQEIAAGHRGRAA